MGPRPFPMKETVKEYLSELKEREQVEESLAEETFKKWMDNEKANLDKLEKDSEKHVEAMKAMEEIEKEIAESVEKGETVQKYGARIMDRAEQAEKAAKMKDIKFDAEAAEQLEKEQEAE